MPNHQRVSRVSEMMKEEIADILTKKVKDPRIGLTTITGVTVTKDLRHAFVSCTIFSPENAEQEALNGLEQASGFIRAELGRRLHLRRIPDLTFRCDVMIEKTHRVLTIIDELNIAQEPLGESKHPIHSELGKSNG